MKNPSDMTDRELDAAIAVEVMGWSDVRYQWYASTSISDAWQVVERMRELGLDPLVRFEGDKCLCVCNASTDESDSVTTWHSDRVYSTSRRRVTVTASTAPRAICEAALAAVRNSTPTTKEQP